MKKILMIAIVLIAGVNLKAQNQINGNVVEHGENGEEFPIPGANVYWEGTTTGVATDENGNFSIAEPENYPATIVVSFVGYQKYTMLINANSKLHIDLSPSVELEEVKVKGKVNTTRYSTIDSKNMQVLSNKELEKAACCNLSESFETNATVDVSYSDAVSGAKKIKMLGLDGSYMQITQENIPLIRGLSSSYGLNYVPGTWIESIQIMKGAGSVVNGYESFTGQINVEYFTPETADKLYWNMYTNSEQKFENNLAIAKNNGDWNSNLFTHVSYHEKDVDHNDDSFLDIPHIMNINLLNRYIYEGSDVFRAQIYLKGLYEDRVGGQTSEITNPYVVDVHNDMLEIATKTGLRPDENGKGLGLQTAFRRHNQVAQYGDKIYEGLQESAYVNLIRQTEINEQLFKYGFNYNGDRYSESLNDSIFNRVDLVSGLFAEYTHKTDEYFTLVAGVRADYHNQSKMHYTPRVNLKYNPTDDVAIRLSAGKAFRIANVFVENSNLLASSRKIHVAEKLQPEQAWNMGFNVTYCFFINGREGNINADVYRTDFDNQVVVDIENQGELSFYNLKGKSFANTIQVDLGYELFDRFDVKMAYKINDVQSTYGGKSKISPLTPLSRGLLNVSYATVFDKWMFDVTANYVGESRVPSHHTDDAFVLEHFSNPFYLFNAQITKKFNAFDIYLGGENLLGYTQENPIISASDPNSEIFDASLIYAPVNGRMLYLGFRYKL